MGTVGAVAGYCDMHFQTVDMRISWREDNDNLTKLRMGRTW